MLTTSIVGWVKGKDPDDPAPGFYIIWTSDGTETGSDGDLMIKITDFGGTTKTLTFVNYGAATIGDGTIELVEQSSDPTNPAEGNAVIWMSDGTSTGDDGDILIKITAGSTTRTAVLVDFDQI